MSSASGSPHTPSSYSGLPYSTANTSTSAISATGGSGSDPAIPAGPRVPPPGSAGAGTKFASGYFPPLPASSTPTAHVAPPTASPHKPRASSTGQLPAGKTPLFSPPYPTSSLPTYPEDGDQPSESSASAAQGGPAPKRPALGRSRTSTSSEGHTVGGSSETVRSLGSAREDKDKNAPKRASKACENCRLRRRKCSEQRPCKACVEIGLGASCVFRAKARPNRALPKVVDASNAGLNLASLSITPPPDPTIYSAITSPQGAGVSHAHPVRDIDNAVERWAAESGHPMSLNILDPPSLISDLANRPLPPLLSPQEETRAVHAFLDSTAKYFSFLHAPRLLEMLRQYHMTPPHVAAFFQHQPHGGLVTSPGGLRPDERALIYAAICLGRFKELPPDTNNAHHQILVPLHTSPGAAASGLSYGMSGIASLGQAASSVTGLGRSSLSGPSPVAPASAQGGADDAMMSGFQPSASILGQANANTVPMSIKLREVREDAGYFCRALLELQRWGNASLTALGSMHCLHLYTLLSGGASEMRDILGRMVWQVRELGIHRVETANAFPPQERVERLFYTTLHEDNWFATLLDAPPFVLGSTYDLALTPSWETDGVDGERWIDQHPCVVQLTMFENEFLTQIHTTAELSQAYIFDLETRLAEWMKVFREEQMAVPSWMLHTYANIRFHWLRMMLRAPLLSSPAFRLSSLATLGRSASQILLSYHSFSHTASFLPTWGECRRIVSAAHVIVLGHWEGEFAMLESEFLAGVAVDLIGKLEKGCPFVHGAGAKYRVMLGLLGIIPRKPMGNPTAPVDAEEQPPVAPAPEAAPVPPALPVHIPETQTGYLPMSIPPQPHSQQPSPQGQRAPDPVQQAYSLSPDATYRDAAFQQLLTPQQLSAMLPMGISPPPPPPGSAQSQSQAQPHGMVPPALTVDTHRTSLGGSTSTGGIGLSLGIPSDGNRSHQGSQPHSAAVSSTSSGSMLDALPLPVALPPMAALQRHLSPQSAPNPLGHPHTQTHLHPHPHPHQLPHQTSPVPGLSQLPLPLPQMHHGPSTAPPIIGHAAGLPLSLPLQLPLPHGMTFAPGPGQGQGPAPYMTARAGAGQGPMISGQGQGQGHGQGQGQGHGQGASAQTQVPVPLASQTSGAGAGAGHSPGRGYGEEQAYKWLDPWLEDMLWGNDGEGRSPAAQGQAQVQEQGQGTTHGPEGGSRGGQAQTQVQGQGQGTGQGETSQTRGE